ncbi:AraC family transcriptional regulator [Ktedonobacter sp. SOSP1-52]|uniref:helix-turn-helix domain-containing protein n=1 Tax=Ktedonobacter sp. SOSP1-52 TaxID=2778366 RepID=UPI001915B119|nr:AraC family transcriptional regulator [Ktedonobacter sp. SOSP1-52]GHO69997.1 AraC family transcriptional regulator [Ktedonobacter sp. SOSP1-52]
MKKFQHDDARPYQAFDVPPEHIVQSSRGRDWNGFDIADVVHPDDDFVLPALPRHVLVINLSAATEAQERLAGRQGQLGTGSLTILPAGAPSTWHLDSPEEVRHLHLYLPPALLKGVAAEIDLNPERIELIDEIGVSDPQIEALALAFLRELHTNDLGGRLYIDSLTNLFILHLLRQHSSVKLPTKTQRHCLSSRHLKRVQAYIEERLATDLTLAELAAQIHLSPYYFARLFKEATGLSPHQYVLQRRVERAKVLLTTTDWSVLSIAHSVGFANESHLAQYFKRLTGLSPKQYRR